MKNVKRRGAVNILLYEGHSSYNAIRQMISEIDNLKLSTLLQSNLRL
jgi:hypothetical protein